jgi:hypothetical protein
VLADDQIALPMADLTARFNGDGSVVDRSTILYPVACRSGVARATALVATARAPGRDDVISGYIICLPRGFSFTRGDIRWPTPTAPAMPTDTTPRWPISAVTAPSMHALQTVEGLRERGVSLVTALLAFF